MQAPNNFRPELVLIEWMDSRRPDAGWQHLADAQGWSAVRCASVGFLVADDADIKVLAPNMGTWTTRATYSYQERSLSQRPAC